MAPDGRRRELIRGTGVVAVAGLAGCLFGSGGDGGSDGSFDVRVDNRILPADLAAGEFDRSREAVVTVEVDRIVEGDNEVVFERTFELDPEASRTVEDAVTTETGVAYAVNARLDPFYDSNFGRNRDGLRFVPGEESEPADGSIDVVVLDREDGSILAPEVRLEPDPGDAV
jgi:hypothetical protein